MKKVLLAGEATWHNTGYGTYGNVILEKLQKRGYEVAEISGFGYRNDPKSKDRKWKIYYADPDPNIAFEQHLFQTTPNSTLGNWRFELTLLDFKPDYVISFRDPWVDRYICDSPLRPYFRWVYMPTCDSIPLRSEWIYMFKNADAILTYSNWALKELSKYKGINLIDSAPAVAEECFIPLNKDAVKKNYGLSEDAFIIGTVMRNQERKLFPHLFRAFRKILDKNPNKKIKLLCHTSYPDLGWDLPGLLVQNNIENHVYFTHKCANCQNHFLSKWQGPAQFCPFCGDDKVLLPNTTFGLTREQLSELYNCMDLYVQYANCEGFGMSQLEASSCGIPVLSTDYSAMESIVREIDGYPIRLAGKTTDAISGREMAIPDEDHFVSLVQEYISKPFFEKEIKQKKTLLATKKNFSYEKTVDNWVKAFNSCQDCKRWDSAPVKINPNYIINAETPSEMIQQLYDYLGDKKYEWYLLQDLKFLNLRTFDKNSSGFSYNPQERYENATPQLFGKLMQEKIEKLIFWENKRSESIICR